MPVTNGIGHSGATVDKEDGFNAYISLHTRIVRSVFDNPKNYWLRYRKYVYIDTNCGSGCNSEEGVDGSPVIAVSAIRRSGLSFDAHFIDCEQGNIDSLSKLFTPSPSIQFYIADNKEALPTIIKSIPKVAYGLLYMDPNGIPDFQLISDLCTAHKHLDVLIRCPANAIKKNLHHGIKRLPELMSLVPKSRWLIRDVLPDDKWQFTFLFATNYSKWGDWGRNRFYTTDSIEGKDILFRLTFTAKEIDRINQPFFGYIHADNRSDGVCECRINSLQPHHLRYS
jgi:three-Cys-motif partner protein